MMAKPKITTPASSFVGMTLWLLTVAVAVQGETVCPADFIHLRTVGGDGSIDAIHAGMSSPATEGEGVQRLLLRGGTNQETKMFQESPPMREASMPIKVVRQEGSHVDFQIGNLEWFAGQAFSDGITGVDEDEIWLQNQKHVFVTVATDKLGSERCIVPGYSNLAVPAASKEIIQARCFAPSSTRLPDTVESSAFVRVYAKFKALSNDTKSDVKVPDSCSDLHTNFPSDLSSYNKVIEYVFELKCSPKCIDPENYADGNYSKTTAANEGAGVSTNISESKGNVIEGSTHDSSSNGLNDGTNINLSRNLQSSVFRASQIIECEKKMSKNKCNGKDGCTWKKGKCQTDFLVKAVEISDTDDSKCENKSSESKCAKQENCEWYIGSCQAAQVVECAKKSSKSKCNAKEGCEWKKKDNRCKYKQDKAFSKCKDIEMKDPCKAWEDCNWNKEDNKCQDKQDKASSKCKSIEKKDACKVRDDCAWNKEENKCKDKQDKASFNCINIEKKDPCKARENCDWIKEDKKCQEKEGKASKCKDFETKVRCKAWEDCDHHILQVNHLQAVLQIDLLATQLMNQANLSLQVSVLRDQKKMGNLVKIIMSANLNYALVLLRLVVETMRIKLVGLVLVKVFVNQLK